jgi:D-arabinose 1-dehydrogenase-like Zn-dependent alcohol dehydrogenase
MALGHEGAGVVEELGEGVSYLKKGDRVGWGYEHDCCGHCKQCLRGAETFCPERAMYGYADLDQASMGSHAVWNESFLFKIPDSLPNEYAAPLQCAGATVFNALRFHGAKPTDRVGIIGVGGLGHLAIQFASKMGCDVVVFSGSDRKKEEAKRLGAKEFYAVAGVKSLSDIMDLSNPENLVDHLLVCGSGQPDWSLYLPVMAPSGTIYPLSVDNDDMKIPYMPLLLSGLKIQGSLVAARGIHHDMLQFAAKHQIKPIIQKFPMTREGVEECIKTLEDGKMTYRGVLVAQ